MTLLDLIREDVASVRPASRNANEWCASCPRCGGDDRFRIWTEQNRYWCRQCQLKGDTLQYYRDFRGLSFREAARRVGKDLSPEEMRRNQRKREARDIVLKGFYEWRHGIFRHLVNLHDEIFFAEMAYRSICRAPEVWTEEEQNYYPLYLSDLYMALEIARHNAELASDFQTGWKMWKETRQ